MGLDALCLTHGRDFPALAMAVGTGHFDAAREVPEDPKTWRESLEDIFRALLNSKEFIFNH